MTVALAGPGAVGRDAGTADEAASPGVNGAQVPGHEILGVLGRGGMGVVYKARHVVLNRVVALKMIRGGGTAGRAELTRFRSEAEVIARLQHRNIVQVYEVGEWEGRPYFSLEFCPGGSLAARLDGTPLPAAEAARLVEALAGAMQAAHRAGVVHRDLKPANVLLADDGTPKVTDFGLAKKLGEVEGQTVSGAILGTPSYMAPEQAGGRGKEVGPAADVYALGAILYELLTGRPPFKAATLLETVRQVVSDEPAPPRLLNRSLPRDLETVCLKCLEKAPAKRYESAEELAEELRRFQRGEPIRARRAGTGERLLKWARRRPALAALYLLALLTLFLGGGGAAAYLWRQAERTSAEARIANERLTHEKEQTEGALRREETARRELSAAQELLQRVLYFQRVQRAHRAWQDNELGRAEQLLKECPEKLRGWEWRFVHRLCHGELLTLAHDGETRKVCFSPDGTWVVGVGGRGAGGQIKIWDARTGEEARSWRSHDRYIKDVCLNPDGSRLATAGDETIRVWDSRTGRETLTLRAGSDSLCFSPDGTRLAACRRDQVKMWDARTGQEVQSLTDHAGPIATVRFSPDGSRLATCSSDNPIKLWDARTGGEVLRLREHEGGRSLCFSPDGGRLASSARGYTARIWDARSGRELLTLRGHTGWVESVSFSPDGSRLATMSWDRTVKIWEATTGEQLLEFKTPNYRFSGVAFSPDGSRVVSCTADGVVQVWDAARPIESQTLRGHPTDLLDLCFTPDSTTLAGVHVGGTVAVWEARSGRTIPGPYENAPDLGWAYCLSPDGARLAGRSHSLRPREAVKVWDLRTRRQLLALQGDIHCSSICFSPDGRRLAGGLLGGTVKVWEAGSGREESVLAVRPSPVQAPLPSRDDPLIRAPSFHHLIFSPDGTRLAYTLTEWDQNNSYTEAGVWGPKTGEKLFSHRRQGAPGDLCFSPDGGRLALAGVWGDEALRVWDSGTGQERMVLRSHTQHATAVCYAPDGTRLASGADDGTVRIWDTLTGQETLVLRLPARQVRRVCFSPDGAQLAAALEDGTVRVWTAPP